MSLASRRTPLSERLEQANSVSVELVCRSVVQFGKVIVFVEEISRTFVSDR